MKKWIHALLSLVIGLFLLSSLYGDETFGVPIPVVGTSPNSGTTLGVLLAVVTETDGHIDSILAPVAMYNALTGYSVDINYFGFPSEYITYQLYFSHTTENFWEYSIEYIHKHFLFESLHLNAEIGFARESNNRFYGIGPKTEEDDETCYTARNIRGRIKFIIDIVGDFSLSIALKGRRTWVRKGVVEDIPSLEEKFPTITGIHGGYSLPIEVALIYDTRNEEVAPNSGFYARLFVETAHKSLFSSFSFQRYGVEAKAYLPMDRESRFVTAMRFLLEYMDGDDIPFYELSSVGGEKTLRGYGEGRFYDRNRILFNVEERIRAFRFPVAGILLDIEGALFAEFGQVFDSFRDIKIKDIQAVMGVGIRFVVRSQIVAKVDIGYGNEGMAIFAGLHYPF